MIKYTPFLVYCVIPFLIFFFPILIIWFKLAERRDVAEMERDAAAMEARWQRTSYDRRRLYALYTAEGDKAGRANGIAAQMMRAGMDRDYYDQLMSSSATAAEIDAEIGRREENGL